MYAEINELRHAIRTEGTALIQNAWDKVEQHIDFAYGQASSGDTLTLRPFEWQAELPGKDGEITRWSTSRVCGWGGYTIRKLRDGRHVLHRGGDTHGDKPVATFEDAARAAQEDLADRLRHELLRNPVSTGI